jgi:hypothetical protein
MKPIPDAGVRQDSNGNAPKLIDPDSRVTVRPIRPAISYTSLVWDNGSPVQQASASIDLPNVSTVPGNTPARPSADNNVQWRASGR